MSADKKAPTTDKRGRCGSSAGYSAHRRRGEHACAACKAAHSKTTNMRRKGLKPPPSPPAKAVRVEHTPDEPATGRVNAPTPTASAEVRKPTPEARDTQPAKPALPTPPPADEADEPPTPPDWLKAKGKALWSSVTAKYALNDSALVLLGEACRTADRLERFAAALSSRSTLWFEVGDIDQADELGVPVVVNGMIGEARQLQTTLRQTLTQLGVVGVEAANAGGNKSVLDQLADRRAERLARAAEGGA